MNDSPHLNIEISQDQERRLVNLKFDRNIGWCSLSPEDAIAIGMMLIEKADGPWNVLPFKNGKCGLKPN